MPKFKSAETMDGMIKIEVENEQMPEDSPLRTWWFELEPECAEKLVEELYWPIEEAYRCKSSKV